MAMPHWARRAARPAPWLVLCAALVCGAAAIHYLTYGLRAWTLDQRREARIASHALMLPAIDLLNQHGQRLRLFADSAQGSVPAVYIVDFIYTRCPSVCRALGAEFAQLARQLAADGMSGRIGLVSLSFDPRDTVADLLGYAQTYRARTPDWQVVAAGSAEAMAALLRQADVIAIPDGQGGFEHNGGLHVVDAHGRVLAVYALEDFHAAYAFALAHTRGSRP
nr:SCO family protein [uncultured Cupriavidus sp.]